MTNGEITIASVCGQKWPRILSLTMAAAYVHLTLAVFRKQKVYMACVRKFPGMPEAIDREELDRVLSGIREK